MVGRELLKRGANVLASAVVLPSVVSFHIRARWLGPDRALEGSTQALAWLPGLIGQYLRRAFLRRTIAHCAWSATIEYGTLFSQVATRIEHQAYIGPRCHIGWAHIGANALIAAGVHIPSGSQTHGFASMEIPIRDQPGQRQCVAIGDGAWIGSAAVVLADVGADTIVGAGAVVTRPLPALSIAGGVPAKVIRARQEQPSTAA